MGWVSDYISVMNKRYNGALSAQRQPRTDSGEDGDRLQPCQTPIIDCDL